MEFLKVALIIITTTTIFESSSAVLRAEYGVAYNQIGFLHPSCDRHHIAIDIALPTKLQRHTWNYNLTCPTTGRLSAICIHYANLFKDRQRKCAKLDDSIDQRIQTIMDILPSPQIDEDRSKRFSIFSIVTGIVGFVNNYILWRQVKVLESSLDTLTSKHFQLEHKVEILHDDVSLLAQVTADQYIQLRGEIDNTNHRLDTMATNFHRIWELQAENTLGWINFATHLGTQAMSIMSDSNDNYRTMFSYLDSYESGLVDLLEGKIPRQLIPPMDLKNILNMASKEIFKHLPDYSLLHSKLSDYYVRTDLIYKIVDNHLVVVLPIMIKKRNQEPMNLFQIETTPVPFIVSNNKSRKAEGKSYTQVDISKPYLAVLDKNFLELSQIQLDHCETRNKIWTCEQILMQTHQSKLSCASAIYWGLEHDLILNHCDFNYFHNMEPPNSLLHSDGWILMSGLSIPWAFKCHSKATPVRHEGSTYAVTELSSLCDCDIIGEDFYIPAKICQEHIKDLHLRYPINAAVASLLIHDKYNLNYSDLHDKPFNLDISYLHLPIEPNHDVLVDPIRNDKIDLKRVASIINSHKQVYYDREEKQILNSKFESWWSSVDKLALGITFILSLIGAIAAIITLINCFKTHKITAFMGTLLSQIRPSDSATAELTTITLYNVFIALVLQVFCALLLITLMKLLYRIYKNSSLVKILLPTNVNLRSKHQSHMLLEIGDSDYVVHIYICSIACAPLDIKINGRLSTISYHSNWRSLHGLITMPWEEDDITITGYGQGLKMPKHAYIPFYRMSSVGKLVNRDNYTTRLILNGNGFNYVLSESIPNFLIVP